MIRKFYSALFGLLCSVSLISADIVYVANQGSNSVSVIDTLTNQVTTIMDPTFNSFNEPDLLAITPDGKLCLVTNENVGNIFVSVIDTITNTVVDAINVGNSSVEIAISPDGKLALVSHAFSVNAVSIIDIATLTVTGTVSDPLSTFKVPALIAFTPDGTKAYVTNVIGGSGTGSVSIIDMTMSPPTVIGTVMDLLVPTFVNPQGLAVTPDGTKLYVSNFSSDTLSIIDTTNDKVISTILVGLEPELIVFTSDSTKGFVANSSISSDSISKFETVA